LDKLIGDINLTTDKGLKSKDIRFQHGFVDGYRLVDKGNDVVNNLLAPKKKSIKKNLHSKKKSV
jgi:hypothetical protein